MTLHGPRHSRQNRPAGAAEGLALVVASLAAALPWTQVRWLNHLDKHGQVTALIAIDNARFSETTDGRTQLQERLSLTHKG